MKAKVKLKDGAIRCKQKQRNKVKQVNKIDRSRVLMHVKAQHLQLSHINQKYMNYVTLTMHSSN